MIVTYHRVLGKVKRLTERRNQLRAKNQGGQKSYCLVLDLDDYLRTPPRSYPRYVQRVGEFYRSDLGGYFPRSNTFLCDRAGNGDHPRTTTRLVPPLAFQESRFPQPETDRWPPLASPRCHTRDQFLARKLTHPPCLIDHLWAVFGLVQDSFVILGLCGMRFGRL